MAVLPPVLGPLPDEQSDKAIVLRCSGLEHDLRLPVFCCSECGALVPSDLAARHAQFHGVRTQPAARVVEGFVPNWYVNGEEQPDPPDFNRFTVFLDGPDSERDARVSVTFHPPTKGKR